DGSTMTTTRTSWRNRGQTRDRAVEPAPVQASPPDDPPQPDVVPLDIPAGDPLIEYLQQNVSGVIDVERLTLDSPGAQALRRSGVRLALPLVSQGELVGLINLGQRRS